MKTIDRILALLRDENMTALQITEALGVNHSTTTRSINKLRDPKNKRIHICDWLRPIGRMGGNQQAIYRLGNRKDVPRPERDRPAENLRHRIKWGALKNLKKQARSGKLNPFSQLMWAAR
jgi:hypothetical protein